MTTMRGGYLRGEAAGACLIAALSACAGTDEKEVLPPVVLGMLETTAPAYDDGEQRIYQVTRDVRLPYRRAEGAEQPRGDVEPYPHPPFHVVTDSRVTIRFTLSNLEDRPRDVELLIDPWNEFVRYVPGFTTAREMVQPNFSGIQRTFVLAPSARVTGIITPDDVTELARDLTVAMALQRRPPPADGAFGGALLYNRTFNVQNRSSEPDPVLQPWMPAANAPIAAVTGLDVGLRTAEPAKIAVELVIDIEDLRGERLVTDGDPESGKQMGPPGDTLSPPAGGPMM